MTGPRLLILDRDAATYRRLVLEAFPALDVQVAANKAEALPLAGEADILAVVNGVLDDPLATAFGRLKWIQSLSAGTDGFARLTTLPAGMALTSARGGHGPQMAEMAFLHMLGLARQTLRLARNQDRARWERWPQPLLDGKHLVIVGTGFLAGELAARAKAFGLKVTGVTSSVRPIEHFDAVAPRAALPEVLAEADFTILLLPLDETSRNLFDAPMIAAIKPGGFLINLARGGIIDEAALLEALRSGALAGAGLDVFATEPLPADDPLWTAPNLLITPHVGGFSETYTQQVAPILVANLRAYLGGRPQEMINQIKLGG